VAKRREITMSILHPVSVRMVLIKIGSGWEWEVESVLSAHVEVTPRSVTENMQDDDFVQLTALASQAKDLP